MQLSTASFAVIRVCSVLVTASITIACISANAEPVVPGTGIRLRDTGDDFEDPNWQFTHNFPKSSQEIDKQERHPTGESNNGQWYEGIKRGQPDVIRRVETPKGGLPGSNGALLLQSLQTGIPGRPSYQQQQDDFVANVHYQHGTISVGQTPSVVTRVFLPPVDQWENRSGCHFAFRASLETTIRKLFRTENEPYYPGFFLDFEDKDESGRGYDTAVFRLRASSNGNDFDAVQITKTGWWTLGMSFTPDGAVHYYAKPGVEDLTEDDYITTQYPYGFTAERFRTFFFNVCNGDDGRTWSTAFIVDDPAVYIAR